MKNLTISPLLIGLSFSWFVLAACGDDNDEPDVLPELSVESVEIAEGDNGLTVATVTVSADAVASDDITFDFNTADGTAKEGDDYISKSGNLTITAGQQSVDIEIEVVADDHLELIERFDINITNLTNATARTGIGFVTVRDDDPSFDLDEDAEGFISPLEYPSMELVWNDEFDGGTLNTADWNFDVGDGCDQGICQWGNKELQIYTDEASSIALENGRLVIRAVETFPNTYESARINTKGKQNVQYGRIDIRAKLPQGQGLWPALWLLGSNIDEVSWPTSGEIDLMELVGHEPNKIHGTVHFNQGGHQFTGGSKTIPIGETFADRFHVFTILWDETGIQWLLDYNKYFEISQADIGNEYPFDNPFYFLFNVAVGGQWPGSPDDTTTFPQEMVVDYVRVFR